MIHRADGVAAARNNQDRRAIALLLAWKKRGDRGFVFG
jgi:hypothetical protein